MPTGIYDRSKSKPRPRKSDKPQASTGKAPKAAKLPKKPAVKRAPRKARATSSDGSLSAFIREQRPPLDSTAELLRAAGEPVDAEVRGARWAIEVSTNVYGWLAINAKARGVGPDVLLEELVMRHIQLGLS